MMRRRSTFIVAFENDVDSSESTAQQTPLLQTFPLSSSTSLKEGEINPALLQSHPTRRSSLSLPNSKTTNNKTNLTGWRPNRSRALILSFSYLFVLSLGYLLAKFTLLTTYSSSSPTPTSLPRRTLLFQGKPGTEGIGSVMQRFKGLITFSLANDLELIMTETYSEHGYITSEFLNRRNDRKEDLLKVRLPICHLEDHLNQNEICRFAREACENWDGGDWEDESSKRKRVDLGNYCNTFLYNGDSCFDELMNDCTRDWVRDRLLLSSSSNSNAPSTSDTSIELGNHKSSKTIKGQVGIHIRWGDSSFTPSEFTGKFRGSMSISNINLVISKLLSSHPHTNNPLSILILSENLPSFILTQLSFPFTLLPESTDDISSLQLLAESEYLLLGGSSYGVVLAQVSNAKIIFTEEKMKYNGFEKLGIRVLDPGVAIEELQLYV